MSSPFTCPSCGAVSHHPEDKKQGYCGRCHVFTGPDLSRTPTRATWMVEEIARKTGQSVDQWREVSEILGLWWEEACETVAHLAALGGSDPARVARILVGGNGYPGVLGRHPDYRQEWRT